MPLLACVLLHARGTVTTEFGARKRAVSFEHVTGFLTDQHFIARIFTKNDSGWTFCAACGNLFDQRDNAGVGCMHLAVGRTWNKLPFRRARPQSICTT